MLSPPQAPLSLQKEAGAPATFNVRPIRLPSNAKSSKLYWMRKREVAQMLRAMRQPAEDSHGGFRYQVIFVISCFAQVKFQVGKSPFDQSQDPGAQSQLIQKIDFICLIGANWFVGFLHLHKAGILRCGLGVQRIEEEIGDS